MNQAGGKDSLMTYESVSNTQAVLEKVSKTTTERKIMSTKTSIKRIALVAVAALGFGMVSAVSSNAAITVPTGTGSAVFQPDFNGTHSGGANGNYTVTQSAGAGNFVSFTAAHNVVSTGTMASVSVVVTGGSVLSGRGASALCSTNTAGTPGGSYSSAAYASGAWTTGADLLGTSVTNTNCATAFGTGSTAGATTAANFKIGTPTAGTISVAVYANEVVSGVVTPTLIQTFTVIVSGASTVAATTVDTSVGNGAFDPAATGVNKTVYSAAATTGTAAATVTATHKGTDGAAITNALIAPAVTFSISGVGTISNDGGTTTRSYFAVAAGTAVAPSVTVWSDGRAGTATVTVAVGGVNVATSTVVFYGAVASLVATANYTVAHAGSTTVVGPAATDPAIYVVAKDANGTVIPVAQTLIPSSSNAAVAIASNATADAADAISGWNAMQYELLSTMLSKSGDSANIAFSYQKADGTFITSNTIAVTAGGAAKTYALSLDASSYAPGDAMVLTITAKDAAGNAAYDGAASPAVTANKAVIGLPGAGKFTGGKKTVKTGLFAPATDGDFVLSALNVDGVTYTTTTATVSGSTSAAVDAANEATDAANAATDAANAAAEAADAATAAAQDAQAAVAALATQVASLVAGIKAQITSLTNLVIKIQKKVKA